MHTIEISDNANKDPLIGVDKIAKQVASLGRVLTKDYELRQVKIVCLVPCGAVFAADLIRRIDMPIKTVYIKSKSYIDGIKVEPMIEEFGSERTPFAGYHVIIVDGVFETGRTLAKMKALVEERRASSISTCVLVQKRRAVEGGPLCRPDHVCFSIPDVHIEGYGINHQDRARNLPNIKVMNSDLLHLLHEAPVRPPAFAQPAAASRF
jgi:hypoxanthine phosphoribosyltransferase